MLPVIFNDDKNVDALEINKLEKLVLLFKLVIDKFEFVERLFKLLNVVVDVAFKLLINNIELVEKLFKLLKIVVDVLFKLLIDNIELVDKLFKLLFVA